MAVEFKTIKDKRSQCIKHANDLLSGSKLLFEKGLHHISYHLSALALEEIGKSAMLVIGYGSINNQKGFKILKQAGEDHTKKLFWALWGPYFGKKDMSKEQIDSFVDLASKIHSIRLGGLYVDTGEEMHDPNKSVSVEEAKNLISITEARIKMEECYDIKEPNQTTKEDFIWLESSIEDPEKKKLILGKKSIDKLKEFDGDSAKWIRWMHEQFDTAEREGKELLQKELSMTEPPDNQKIQQKWKIRFRLRTLSHTFKNKVLIGWNKRTDRIRLYVGDKKPRPELIVEVILPKGVPIQGLWYVAWGEARRLAVSLNIASKGYFWWYLPQDVSRFYEKIIDLESNTEVRVERSPKLELNWGRDELSESDLVSTIMCYRFLPSDNVDFLNAYVTGISFLGKNDIHTPFENEIYLYFYHALLHAMVFYEDHVHGTPFIDSFEKMFKVIMKDASGVKEYIEMAEELIKNRKARKPITLSECGAMKVLCDVYLHYKIGRMAQKDLGTDKKSKIFLEYSDNTSD